MSALDFRACVEGKITATEYVNRLYEQVHDRPGTQPLEDRHADQNQAMLTKTRTRTWTDDAGITWGQREEHFALTTTSGGWRDVGHPFVIRNPNVKQARVPTPRWLDGVIIALGAGLAAGVVSLFV